VDVQIEEKEILGLTDAREEREKRYKHIVGFYLLTDEIL